MYQRLGYFTVQMMVPISCCPVKVEADPYIVSMIVQYFTSSLGGDRNVVSISTKAEKMEIHLRTPLTGSVPHLLNSSLIHRGRLFHLKFMTSPLAVGSSKPLFVRCNLGILQNR